MKNKQYVGASEFKLYSFCPRAWYLSQFLKNKGTSRSVRRGNEYHHRRSMEVQQVRNTQSALTWVLTTLGGIICLVCLAHLLSR